MKRVILFSTLCSLSFGSSWCMKPDAVSPEATGFARDIAKLRELGYHEAANEKVRLKTLEMGVLQEVFGSIETDGSTDGNEEKGFEKENIISSISLQEETAKAFVASVNFVDDVLPKILESKEGQYSKSEAHSLFSVLLKQESCEGAMDPIVQYILAQEEGEKKTSGRKSVDFFSGHNEAISLMLRALVRIPSSVQLYNEIMEEGMTEEVVRPSGENPFDGKED